MRRLKHHDFGQHYFSDGQIEQAKKEGWVEAPKKVPQQIPQEHPQKRQYEPRNK